MKPGAGKEKGSNWEREVGYILSQWISKGTRTDLFCRTVLSGGQYTVSKRGNPGDLMSQDPLAQPFCDRVLIECKHWKDLDYYIHKLLLGKDLLYKAIQKTDQQATELRKNWFFIARNNLDPLIITPTLSYHRDVWTNVSIAGIPTFSILNFKTYLETITYEEFML